MVIVLACAASSNRGVPTESDEEKSYTRCEESTIAIYPYSDGRQCPFLILDELIITHIVEFLTCSIVLERCQPERDRRLAALKTLPGRPQGQASHYPTPRVPLSLPLSSESSSMEHVSLKSRCRWVDSQA